MKNITIENPVINSPFQEPTRHYKFDDEGITNETIESRRVSSYIVPIPKARKKSTQLSLYSGLTEDRNKENEEINRIRKNVARWKQVGHLRDVTKTTAYLLNYWKNPNREKRLFFCQIEALETAIYITEAAKNLGDNWTTEYLRQANQESNSSLNRIAFKMATGSGKTVVMAMLIAWHALNKLANPQDRRFSDTFLIVTPGITIRDRLRVLLPNDPQNYYKYWDIVPEHLLTEMHRAKIFITNYHAFLQREKSPASRLARKLSRQEETGISKESPDQMVRRVCGELGTKKSIMVINDEGHHCYRGKSEGEDVKLKGDERKEAEKREEAARVWISGLEAVQSKIGIKTVYDLSATPFFLRGSGYSEGTLFPWVVSDFSLTDAIESGIVKVPRVPVADDQMIGEQPTYRDIWIRIRDDLPKKGRKAEDLSTVEPKPPKELEGALHSLYSNYEKHFAIWQGDTPPVFIVVCNNTNVSKLVYDYISGYEKELADGTKIIVPGKLALFSNAKDNRWLARPNTILIDSEQLDSGEATSAEFKRAAAQEIEKFKSEIRARFPGRDTDKLTDEDLLREVMNTVGKPERLGEQIRCVVSVSMLTEGWDASTITHILGVRAFGTQLLCEQVVGRGLRRLNYEPDENGFFNTEYAEVYGVPFAFIPCAGTASVVKPMTPPRKVRALEERGALEITFPRLIGYRYDLPTEKLNVNFTSDSRQSLTTKDLPTIVENAPIVGEKSIHNLDDLKSRRIQEVAFLLAKLTLEKYFRQDGIERTDRPQTHKFDAEVQAWFFPQLVSIARRWIEECVVCKDNTFPQLLLLIEYAHQAADKIYQAIVKSTEGEKTLKPILRPYDYIGSTRYVNFDTIKPVYETKVDKCHINRVVADTKDWEQKLAHSLEDMEEVICYVKNQNLYFEIPYTFEGEEHFYQPDFIVRIRNPKAKKEDAVLNLIIEVTGKKDQPKEAKVNAAKNLWIPAVNNYGGFGRWAFLEIRDPSNAQNEIRDFLRTLGNP
jgi:type III restriction enzyme